MTGLREEVKEFRVRVLSVYPGRTATPMQESVARLEKRPYQPTDMDHPEDVARTVSFALLQHRGADVRDIHIRSFQGQLLCAT